MPTSIRTLSQLPEILSNALPDNAYFETSIPIAVSVDVSGQQLNEIFYKYASRKISSNELKKNISRTVREKLAEDTGIYSQDFGKMYSNYGHLISGEFTLDGTKTFVENPIILKDALSSFDISTNYSVSLSALKRYTNLNAAPAVGSGFGFVSRLSSGIDQSRNVSLYTIDTKGKKVVSSPSYVFSPDAAKIISENEYIFKINQGERESKTWIAPATGIFTCYGWLDEINNESASNENRWVALLAYQEQLGVWTTLQVQPFIKNNYLSYVGFTFPVHKGLQLKVRTGFAVGSNSDKYFRSSSSLANHIPNAFLGGIYTGISVDFDNLQDGEYSICVDPSIQELSNILCASLSHENECDISVNNRINDLESRLVTNETVDCLSSEIDKRVKYIDTYSYSSEPLTAALRIYNRMFKPNNGNLDTLYQQSYLCSTTQPLLCCELTSIFNMSYRSYYAPPTFAESLNSGEIGYVETAYTLRSEPPYGKVFSDGKYLFYCVSQDCTAIVKMFSDFAPRGYSGIAGYMLCPNSTTTNNKPLVNIGKCPEMFGYLTDPPVTMSLPVKKGTIFMFYPWMTENLTTNTKIASKLSNYDHLARNVFITLNCPAYIPFSDSSLAWTNDLYSKNTTTNASDFDGTIISYNSYAVWTSDEDQRNKLVGTGPGKYGRLFGTNQLDSDYGTIAEIVELP